MNCVQATSDRANTTSVVHSAAQRMLFLARSSVAARNHQNESGADQRQEGQAGENAETEHQCAPPTRYQVMSAATPISMAKA